MDLDAESLKKYIPYYLTADDQEQLVKELKAIAGGGTADYFLSSYYDEFREHMLQGDGWRGFRVYIFETGEVRSVRGIVLSNSCDVDPDNPRDMPARVIFAPLVKLSSYENVLKDRGIDAEKLGAKIESIRSQKTTNMFYLPAGGALDEDHVVRLDEAQSLPIALHNRSGEREKLFTLSNTGFYMFVLKLSIHFCRLQERVNRKPVTV